MELPTSDEIALARHAAGQKYPDDYRSFDFEVLAAYVYLAAQVRTKNRQKIHGLKHKVENFARCYLRQESVEAAAKLLDIEGKYPRFNISQVEVLPNPFIVGMIVGDRGWGGSRGRARRGFPEPVGGS